MNRSLRRFRRVAWLPIVATAAVSAATMSPAGAVLPSTEIAIAIGGSDTTAKMLDSIAPALSGTSVNITGDGTKAARLYNIPPFSTSSFVVPGDSTGYGCAADVTWVKDPLAPAANSPTTKGISPFGSTAGRNYLAEEHDGTGPGGATGEDFGCLDVARSSSGPRNGATGGDFSTFEYYAFALDAVSWASTSLKAPATLTTAQIRDIYDCDITDWATVGGSPGPIQRYIPQFGSGTRGFFISDILGLSSSLADSGFPSNASCPAVIPIEENRGKHSAASPGVQAVNLDKAILPYSAAVWAFQEANRVNPTLDIRGGALIKGIIHTNGTTVTNGAPVVWVSGDNAYSLDPAVISEANVRLVDTTPDFIGVRYVFNVIDSVSNRPGYQAAKQILGFDNVAAGAKGPGCDFSTTGGESVLDAILSNKFAPLGTSGGLPASNLAGSNCRLFAPTGAPS